MKPDWHSRWCLAALATDLVALSVALGGAALLRFGPFGAFERAFFGGGSELLSAPWLLAIPIWVGAFAVVGLYNASRWKDAFNEARGIVVGGAAAPVAFVLVAFAVKQDPSRLWVGISSLSAIATVGVGRRALRYAVVRLRRRGRWWTPAVVVGRREAKRVTEMLLHDAEAGILPMATCGFDYDGLPEHSLESLAHAVRSTEAGAILIVADDLDRHEVQRSVAVSDDLPAEVVVLPGLDYTLAHSLHVVPIGREPGIVLEPPSLRVYQRVLKRGADIVAGSIALVLSSPLMAVVALAIRLESPGKVIFRQRRVGYRGHEFDMLKFRTMVDGAHELKRKVRSENESDGLLFKIREDPRSTRTGRFLRRFSLDELPQFWNVVRGEMSLVGPRPALPEEVALYAGAVGRRLAMRPGMTGIWQISGRSDLPFEEYVRLDVTYVQNWSIILDLYILIRTLPVVVSGRGAY